MSIIKYLRENKKGSWHETFDIFIQGLEHYPVSIASAVLTWIAPLTTAYVVWHSLHYKLNLPVEIAYAGSATLEFMALIAIGTAMRLRRFNATRKRIGDERAPVFLAYATVGLYLIIVILLTAFVDLLPEYVSFTTLLYPFITLISATIISLRLEQSDRQRLVDKQDKERDLSKWELKLRKVETKLTKQKAELADVDAQLQLVNEKETSVNARLLEFETEVDEVNGLREAVDLKETELIKEQQRLLNEQQRFTEEQQQLTAEQQQLTEWQQQLTVEQGLVNDLQQAATDRQLRVDDQEVELEAREDAVKVIQNVLDVLDPYLVDVIYYAADAGELTGAELARKYNITPQAVSKAKSKVLHGGK